MQYNRISLIGNGDEKKKGEKRNPLTIRSRFTGAVEDKIQERVRQRWQGPFLGGMTGEKNIF